MIERSVQPIAENAFRNGPMRRSIANRQGADDERDRDRRADVIERRAEMAEIARAGDEQPKPLRGLKRPRQQIGRRDQRPGLPDREEQQREQMGRKPSASKASDNAARLQRWGKRSAGLAHQARSACSQTTLRISGWFWIIPISFDSS
jgi:hypothetical protein